MIPKSGKSPADSRKSVGIHEFAALARSSLNGDKNFHGFRGVYALKFNTFLSPSRVQEFLKPLGTM